MNVSAAWTHVDLFTFAPQTLVQRCIIMDMIPFKGTFRTIYVISHQAVHQVMYSFSGIYYGPYKQKINTRKNPKPNAFNRDDDIHVHDIEGSHNSKV